MNASISLMEQEDKVAVYWYTALLENQEVLCCVANFPYLYPLLLSVTIIVAYLMKKHGMSLSEALEHVRSKRPLAAPNSGFIQQLKEFEKSLQANREQMKANE